MRLFHVQLFAFFPHYIGKDFPLHALHENWSCDTEVPFDLSVDGVECHLSVSVYEVFLVDLVTVCVHGLDFHKHLKI